MHEEFASSTKFLLHFLEHMDYVRQLIGVDYIGLGSDFDGME